MVAAASHPLAPEDQALLDALAQARSDLLSLATTRNLAPSAALAWSLRPDIQPWIDHLLALEARRREQQVADALAAALAQLQLILQSDLDAPTRLKTTNTLIRLSQALLRSTRPPQRRRAAEWSRRTNPSRREGQGWARSAPDQPRPDAHAEPGATGSGAAARQTPRSLDAATSGSSPVNTRPSPNELIAALQRAQRPSDLPPVHPPGAMGIQRRTPSAYRPRPASLLAAAGAPP